MKKNTRPVLVEYLAINLRRTRAARGMTQEQVAEACDLSVAYISLLERSGRTAPLKTVERIAKAIRIQPHELLLPPRPT